MVYVRPSSILEGFSMKQAGVHVTVASDGFLPAYQLLDVCVTSAGHTAWEWQQVLDS